MTKPVIKTAAKDGPPVTITQGERLRWQSMYQAGTNRYTYTPVGLMEQLSDDGHDASLTIKIVGAGYPSTVLRCSCGHESERFSLNWGGRPASGAGAAWLAHAQELAVPLTVWMAESARTHYECMVLTTDIMDGVLSAGQTDSYRKRAEVWGWRFLVVRKAVSIKTGKVTTPARVINSYNNLSAAVQYAKNLGLREEMNGKTVNWIEDAPVKKSTGEASAILAVLDQAKEPASILKAVELADAYLTYAEVITDKKEEALRRLGTLLTVDD